ncbi:unnamed protein product [Rotaria magnacalcarata]|uniref:C2 domain-containing protein n=1 Tax=Rotaria magnacalcarata TaxID=392030 RepID=A0A8S2M5G0_9BILA|nr:unnamed protein product [Rotaria magnacalcarata]
MSVSPSILNPQLSTRRQSGMDAIVKTKHQMLQFDYNKNPITLKCRLYIIKAVLYRGWDQSGKADPFIKIALNNTTIIDDTEGKLRNTLEPVFGKSFEFDVQLPIQNLICIQLWDWDMTSSNDLMAETKIDIENRWFSCHRATCGLPKRYDSVGYNVWRDTKKPTQILEELCRTADIDSPVYAPDFQSLKIADDVFECDPECIEFIKHAKTAGDTIHRKAHHESPDDYTKENTALMALNKWGKTINPKLALVTEHIECRSLFNPEFPNIEQGKLEMWLDFFPMSRPPSSGITDITPPKPTSYQLRLTVWNTSDVELNDENFLTGEKSSDIYVKAWIVGENVDAEQTDIHYRSLSGEGNFNWRFIFDFQFLDIEEKIVFEAKDSVFQVGNTVKKIPPRIIIRVYDADFFSADDFLGECILNLTSFKYGAKSSKRCKADILLDPKHKGTNLFTSKRISGWWPMIAPLKPGEIRDTNLLGGKLEAEFLLVTAEEAEKSPVGKAREAPQPLEEPNRPKTSFLWFTSPWKVFRYVLWRNYKWTLLLTVVIFITLICLLIGLWTLPVSGSNREAVAVKVQLNSKIENCVYFCAQHTTAYQTPENAQLRAQQISDIVNVLQPLGHPFVLMGDLNLHYNFEDSVVINNGFIDAWAQTHFSRIYPFNDENQGYTFDVVKNNLIPYYIPGEYRQMRLDRILFSCGFPAFAIKPCAPWANEPIKSGNYLFPSDHFGLFIDIVTDIINDSKAFIPMGESDPSAEDILFMNAQNNKNQRAYRLGLIRTIEAYVSHMAWLGAFALGLK